MKRKMSIEILSLIVPGKDLKYIEKKGKNGKVKVKNIGKIKGLLMLMLMLRKMSLQKKMIKQKRRIKYGLIVPGRDLK